MLGKATSNPGFFTSQCQATLRQLVIAGALPLIPETDTRLSRYGDLIS